MADPEVKRAAAQLRRAWPTMGHIERGDALRQLVASGCSTRGLAEVIGVAPTTVRRFLEIASLPSSLRQTVANGTSAKRVLQSRAAERRRGAVVERLTLEKESGKFSDELADVLVGFAKGESGGNLRMTRDEFPVFLTSVARAVLSPDACRTKPKRISKKLDLRAQLKAAKPRRAASDNPLEQRAEWLAHFIRARFPERAIWERAMAKALKREKELAPGHSLAETLRSRSWEPTFIQIPARPITRPAREVMKRQGRKPIQQ